MEARARARSLPFSDGSHYDLTAETNNSRLPSASRLNRVSLTFAIGLLRGRTGRVADTNSAIRFSL